MSYFDPISKTRLDGIDAMKAMVAPLRTMPNPITEPRYEMINPRVQNFGDVAILTFQVVNYGNARRVEEARLSQGAGGLSGPEIFPATLDHVRRTRQRFGGALDIVGTGGVDAPDKALALLDAGATAVGYFTGFITRGPLLARRICEHLLARRGG